MTMRFAMWVLAGLLVATGCGRKKPPPVPAPADAPPPAPAPPAENMLPLEPDARIYYDDAAAAFPDSVRLTIRDPETWGNIWSRATAGQASAPPLPAVDFKRHMVLLVGAGRLRSGDQIRVDSVGTRRGTTVVVVRTIVECEPFPAVAYPFEIVRVKRSEGPVLFAERQGKPENCQ